MLLLLCTMGMGSSWCETTKLVSSGGVGQGHDFAESAKKISIDFALIFGQAVSG